MKELFEQFLTWTPAMQVQFLKSEQFKDLSKEDKIAFLKEAARYEAISSKVVAASIRLLRELKWRDRVFYEHFSQHTDVSVAMAARRALNACTPRMDTDFFKMRELVKRQNREKKIEAVQQIGQTEEEAAEDLLISFLGETDLKVRELAVRELSSRPVLDERKLMYMLDRSVWHMKATLIEVLGNRKSELLLEKVESLLKDPNAEVRLKLVQALSRLDRDRIKKYLSTLANDTHIYVRREANRLLNQV